MTGAEVLLSKFVCDMAVMLDENAGLKRQVEALRLKMLDKDTRIAELDAALLEMAENAKKPSVVLRAAGVANTAAPPMQAYSAEANLSNGHNQKDQADHG